jgi:hypothetical protein
MKQRRIHLFVYCSLYALQSIYCNLHTWNRVPRCAICIHCNLFIHLHMLQSIHSSIYITIYSFHSSIWSIKRRFLVNWPQYADGGGFHARAVEQRRRQRRRLTRATLTAIEETGSSGVDGGGGDRRSRERWGLREFWDEKRNDTGLTTIYRFKNINSGS